MSNKYQYRVNETLTDSVSRENMSINNIRENSIQLLAICRGMKYPNRLKENETEPLYSNFKTHYFSFAYFQCLTLHLYCIVERFKNTHAFDAPLCLLACVALVDAIVTSLVEIGARLARRVFKIEYVIMV